MAIPRPTARGFQERRGLLFVGALHFEEGPNFDSLNWFVTEILPLVAEALGEDVRFTIAGHIAAGVDMARFKSDPRIVVHGEAEDLAPLYDAARIFVAPTRFAGGIPFKVHEAASFGLPVVATSLLCRQLDWTDRIEIVDGGDNDAVQFARRVIELYQDAELWERVREMALNHIRAENSAESFRSNVARILSDTLACGTDAH
jgi:glycosyltransferase involved in cell wall biosynthesis